jgi:hypothetical protein
MSLLLPNIKQESHENEPISASSNGGLSHGTNETSPDRTTEEVFSSCPGAHFSLKIFRNMKTLSAFNQS